MDMGSINNYEHQRNILTQNAHRSPVRKLPYNCIEIARMQSPNKSAFSISTKNSESPIELIACKRNLQKINVGLNKLEEEKKVYERKIKEMSHSSPVHIQTFDTSVPLNVRIQSMKRDLSAKREHDNSKKSSMNSEDSNIENELCRLKELVKKQQKTNEEYRNYISILKDAINTKISDMNLSNKFDQFCAKKRDRVDTFSEFMMLQSKIEEHNRITKESFQKSLYKNELSIESSNSMHHTEQTSISDITNKLNNTLIELKEAQTQLKYEKSKTETMQTSISKYEEQNTKQEKKIKEFEGNIKKQEDALKIIQTNYNKAKNDLKQAQNELQKQIDINKRDEEKQVCVNSVGVGTDIDENKELKIQLEKAQADIQKLKADCNEKDGILKQLQNAVYQYKTQRNDEKYNGGVSPAFKHLQQSTNNYQIENIKLYQENSSLRNQIVTLRSTILNISEKNDCLNEELQQCKLILKSVDTMKCDQAQYDEV